MTTRPNPYDDPGPWGRFKIGSIYLPGVILSIDGAEKPEKWIFQMGLAVSQAVSIWRGTQLAESVKVVGCVWSRDTFSPLWEMRDTLRPKLGRRPPSFQIVNGIMNFAGIYRGALRNLTQLRPAPGLAWTYGVELCEYNPMKAVPVGPADPPKAETENDRKEKVFSGLVRKAASF